MTLILSASKLCQIWQSFLADRSDCLCYYQSNSNAFLNIEPEVLKSNVQCLFASIKTKLDAIVVHTSSDSLYIDFTISNGIGTHSYLVSLVGGEFSHDQRTKPTE